MCFKEILKKKENSFPSRILSVNVTPIFRHLLKKSLMENFIFCAVWVAAMLKNGMPVKKG